MASPAISCNLGRQSEIIKMVTRTYIVLAIALSALFSSACSTSGTPVVGGSSPEQQESTAATDNLQISDISMPPGAKLDASNTLMIGSGDRWFGRVVIKTDTSTVQVFNHFKSGMPALGWRLVSMMQSKSSLIIFQRGERIAMVQIESLQLGGAVATVNVSLQEQGQPKSPGR
jgi:hypothetical protein